MKNLLYVTIIGSFCLTISCAHKNKTIDKTESLTLKIPITKSVPEVTSNPTTLVTTTDTNEYECSVNGDSRIIRINKSDTKCTVDYTKKGSTSEVAWGKATREICTNVLDNIKNNIENAGFKCNSRMSSGS